MIGFVDYRVPPFIWILLGTTSFVEIKRSFLKFQINDFSINRYYGGFTTGCPMRAKNKGKKRLSNLGFQIF